MTASQSPAEEKTGWNRRKIKRCRRKGKNTTSNTTSPRKLPRLSRATTQGQWTTDKGTPWIGNVAYLFGRARACLLLSWGLERSRYISFVKLSRRDALYLDWRTREVAKIRSFRGCKSEAWSTEGSRKQIGGKNFGWRLSKTPMSYCVRLCGAIVSRALPDRGWTQPALRPSRESRHAGGRTGVLMGSCRHVPVQLLVLPSHCRYFNSRRR